MQFCKYCGEEIYWVTDSDGKKLPMELWGAVHNCGEFEDFIYDSSSVDDKLHKTKCQTYPIICPLCRKEIFYHVAKSGKKYFFEKLEIPFATHPCTSELMSNINFLRGLEKKLPATPFIFERRIKEKLFDNRFLNVKVLGLTVKRNLESKSVYLLKRKNPPIKEKKIIRSASLYFGHGKYLKVYFWEPCVPEICQIYELFLKEQNFDKQEILYTKNITLIEPENHIKIQSK